MTINLTLEFSRPVKVEDLKAHPRSYEIKANALECRALAKRFSLISIEWLTAVMLLTPQKNGLVRLEGRLSAKVKQTCVITLEPLEALIETSFDQMHGGDANDQYDQEMEFSLNDDLMPDPIIDGAIDLGLIAAEKLALELDPFPRKPGAAFKGYESKEDSLADETVKNRPFTELAKLIKNRK